MGSSRCRPPCASAGFYTASMYFSTFWTVKLWEQLRENYEVMVFTK